MNNYKFQTNQLSVGAKVFIEGRTAFSRLAKHIDGDELQKDIANKQHRGMTPITKPYTTITIKDAKIRPQNPAGVLTIEEQYVQERFYTKQEVNPANNMPVGTTLCYTVNNKSPYLPTISQFKPESNVAEQIDLNGQELDTGLHVIICLSVYQPKNFSNKGLGLDGIIVMEPIRYYTTANNDLSALGITYKPLPTDAAKAAATPNPVTAQPATTPAPSVQAPAPAMQPSTPMPAMQPQQRPVPTQIPPIQTATPVGGTPQMQPTAPNPMMNAMNPPVMGEPATPWVCPSCGTTNPAGQKFCGCCGSSKPSGTAVNNPYALHVNPAQPQTGIVYEPNPTDRNY